ncbi:MULTISPECIES: hypothetical protein [Candidatus Accumulibacter]|jgi:hypothetical protein|uniref:Uncharacterized protein n=1 Tax=Candidatus Accumulibacter phosphatis TaxID=327160 RepID=A0A5S4F7T7_9PROT|nr:MULTISPECIES: hypothetical protein [Candidatus Accumulibacter]TMQ76833.1 hypothetical protein ACCUM_3873 [Candidatus Accumulibacter phosphatis]
MPARIQTPKEAGSLLSGYGFAGAAMQLSAIGMVSTATATG